MSERESQAAGSEGGLGMNAIANVEKAIEISPEQLAEIVEAAAKVWPTDSVRVYEWHPDDARLYRQGGWKSHYERNNAVLAQRQKRVAEAVIAAAYPVITASANEQIERLTAENASLESQDEAGVELIDALHHELAAEREKQEAAEAKVARVEAWLRRVVGNGKDWFDVWAWETLPELGAALSTQENGDECVMNMGRCIKRSHTHDASTQEDSNDAAAEQLITTLIGERDSARDGAVTFMAERDTLRAKVAALEAKVARVEALCDEWERGIRTAQESILATDISFVIECTKERLSEVRAALSTQEDSK